MIVTRFAPSPTGRLHLGHALAAITAFDAAARAGGQFLVRIEDIDISRARGAFESAIFDDLAWLGLRWPEPVLRQRDRFDAYRAVLDTLSGDGLLYPCFCRRSDIAAEIARCAEAPHGPDGPLYPGTCKSLSVVEREERIGAGQAYALRLDSARTAARLPALSFVEEGRSPNGETGEITVKPTLFGDVVLARKEMPASYHLAVVVDDAFQDVSLVTRGNDLFAATHVQRTLQCLLGLPVPSYKHHRLILDDHGHKLSKREGATTLGDLRRMGRTPQDIRALLQL